MTMTATEAPATRLLAGYHELGRVAGLEDHLERYGPLPPEDAPAPTRPQLINAIEEAGLTDRTAEPLPTGHRLRSLAAAGHARAVVVDAVETEPASGKDRLLLTIAPHLVLDGAALAAYAVGAHEIIVRVRAAGTHAAGAEKAVAERARARLTAIPIRVHRAEVGSAPYDAAEGMAADPETLAHIALIARYGPEWFRRCGTAETPGTALFTVSGAVVHPGVVEVPMGTSVAELLRRAGGPSEPVRSLLTGGYSGTWLPPALLNIPASPALFASVGVTLGPGVVIALSARACPLAESARILTWLADRYAGTCDHGLPGIAEDFARLTAGGVEQRFRDRLKNVPAGECRHDHDAARFAEGALRIFEEHLRDHENPGTCPAALRPGVLPLPRIR